MTLSSSKEIHPTTQKVFPRSYRGKRLEGKRATIDLCSSSFPDALRHIPVPPKKLYVIGNLGALREGLAIVGARKATPYGLSCSEHFAGLAAALGINIISGGAYGCDAAAHSAALQVGGTTSVFLGGGCDEPYPASNVSLFQKVINQGGVVVSEYPWDHPPLKHTFRTRNRLIAGLARVTLIVEAGLPSGTFSTADEALAASKDVLVIPGCINSPSSHGANRLLYQGATPIVDNESFSDVLFSLFGVDRQHDFGNPEQKASSIGIESARQKALYKALCAQPLYLDEMIEYIAEKRILGDSRELLMLDLVELEKRGYVVRYRDGRYGSQKLEI